MITPKDMERLAKDVWRVFNRRSSQRQQEEFMDEWEAVALDYDGEGGWKPISELSKGSEGEAVALDAP